MSGRLHHPLQTIEDVDPAADPAADRAADPAADPAAGSGQDATTPAHSSDAGQGGSDRATPWTAGLSVESAADIAARDAAVAESAAVGAEPGAAEDARFSGAGEHWSDAPAADVLDPATSDWATSQLVRDNEVSVDDEAPAARVEPAPAPEPVEYPDDRTEADGPAPATRVNFAVWMDNDLRRRVRAAHIYTGDDEGYDTLSDYVSTVLERDVQRIERTYNEGAAFPTEDDEPEATGEHYEVLARYGEGLWELRIGDAGVTLSPTLAGAETMARTYLGVLNDVPADSVSVTVIPELDGDLSGEIVRSRRRTARAEEAVSRAEEMLAAARDELGQVRDDRRQLVRRLSEHGLSAADVDTVLALTPDA